MPRPRLPFPINFVIIAAGALLVGHSAASDVANVNPSTVVQERTTTTWQTRVVTRKIRGHVQTIPGGTKVVIVHSFVVHTDEHTIRIPQQTLSVTSLHGAVVAHPLVPVTVTVYVPTVSTTTVTATVTTTETDIVPTTITVSVPLDPTLSDQRRNPHDCLYRPVERQRHGRLCPRSGHPHLPEGD